MSAFYISVKNRNGTDIILPKNSIITPEAWSSTAVGGCENATIAIQGPSEGVWLSVKWLGYQIQIYNHLHDLVWWGHISEVNVSQGSFSAGISLDSMSNRIRVAYSYNLADGTSIRGDTLWAQDDDSIDRYGTKELQHSGGADLTDLAAGELRDSLLDQLKFPIPTIAAGESGESASATLTCRGDYDLLNWQYYTELRGLEQSNSNGNTSIPVGYGFTAHLSWFGGEELEMWATSQVLDALEPEMVIDVTGGNAGAWTIASTARGEVESVTGPVEFTADNTIVDAANVVGKWGTGDVILVSGTSSNNRAFRIDKIEDRTTVETEPELIVTESAGSATITRGYNLKVVETPAELYHTSSTVTPRGYIIAQSFQLEHNVSSWTCDTISIRVLRVGSPGDSLKVELRSGGSSPSETVLAQQTIAASEIFDTRAGWYEFDMGNTVSLSFGTSYWIVVSRTGVLDPLNYYEVPIDEDAPYTLGSMKLRTIGGAWVTRTTDATMPFIVRGRELITTQISNILTNYAQFVVNSEILTASTVSTNQYRVGDTKSLFDLENLLALGVNNGRRYICHMTPERRLVIDEEPEKDDSPQLSIAHDGTLMTSVGGIYPAGRLPVGQWVGVDVRHFAGDAIAQLSPYFVERAEFSTNSFQTRLEPRHNDPFDIRIKQG